MKTKLSRIIISAMIVSISATFNSSMITKGFILSASGIMLPLLLYLNWDVISLELCPVVALISPLLRWFLVYEPGHGFENIIMVIPDGLFYIVYAVVFYLVYNWHFQRKREIKYVLIATFLSDAISNMAEISARVYPEFIHYAMIKPVILIALGRTLILLAILVLINYYSGFLSRQEHERKYRKLILMASQLRSEIYFMHRNSDRIESVMNKSFEAYKIIRDSKTSQSVQELLLDVAKDVHELKKDNLRVISVIEGLYPELTEIYQMTVEEIVKMIGVNVKEMQRDHSGRMYFTYNVKSALIVKSHYLFMSILNNLVYNAIEAGDENHMNYVELTVFEEGENLVVNVSDTGTGIEAEYLNRIFNPGFTSKFDTHTGDSSRGLGLTLVKSLVEVDFMGQIDVYSFEGKGTTFTVRIPVSVVRGEV